jgi:hypothetical protein
MSQRSPFVALLLAFALSAAVVAQSSPDKKNPQSKGNKTKTSKSEEADPVLEQRRVVAVSLLSALADEARSFRDLGLRARVEARAADAFWDTDVERARTLFRKAWEEAEGADAEAAKRQAEDMRRQQQGGGPVLIQRMRDVRSEVLRLAAKRDAKLGEEFLKKLTDSEEQQKKDMADPRFDPGQASLEAAKRIQLARRLLDDGDVDRALQFAAPVLDSVSRDAIFFLSALREKNAQVADQGFLSLLARVERDPASDANSVSGLSSYAFTPFLYVVFSKDGGVNMSQERPETPRPDLPENIRRTFFRVAAEVLLRPLAAPDQDLTTSGRNGKYMVLRRLLPLFEQYAPDMAPVMKTHAAALSGDVPQGLASENRAITRGIMPDDTSRTPQERMQDRLDRARTSEERDAIYADYAVSLAGKDPKANELVDKIEDAQTRKNVKGYIDFQTAQQAINSGDANEAARLAKTGELTSPQRIWLYVRAANIFMKVDRTRAVELLDEAAAEARRIAANSPDRAKGLVAVSTLLLQVDRVRGWEVVAEALKAANGSEGFTGEDSTVAALLKTRQMVLVSNASAEEFNLLGLFRALAKDDLNRSIELAKSFTGESPRAAATLAIARSVLEKPVTESSTLE